MTLATGRNFLTGYVPTQSGLGLLKATGYCPLRLFGSHDELFMTLPGPAVAANLIPVRHYTTPFARQPAQVMVIHCNKSPRFSLKGSRLQQLFHVTFPATTYRTAQLIHTPLFANTHRQHSPCSRSHWPSIDNAVRISDSAVTYVFFDIGVCGRIDHSARDHFDIFTEYWLLTLNKRESSLYCSLI